MPVSTLSSFSNTPYGTPGVTTRTNPQALNVLQTEVPDQQLGVNSNSAQSVVSPYLSTDSAAVLRQWLLNRSQTSSSLSLPTSDMYSSITSASPETTLSNSLQPSAVDSSLPASPTQRPKTIAVFGPRGKKAVDVDGDGLYDFTRVEWASILAKAQYPDARVIEYTAIDSEPENLTRGLKAIDADIAQGLVIDDLVFTPTILEKYEHFRSEKYSKLTPSNIADDKATVDAKGQAKGFFNRLKSTFMMLDQLSSKTKIHIPGGNTLARRGMRYKDPAEYFNVWNLAPGAQHYRAVNENGEPDPYSINNSMLQSESKGKTMIYRLSDGYDINEDGRTDIPLTDPRLTGHATVYEKFVGKPLETVLATPEEFEQVKPYFPVLFRSGWAPIPDDMVDLMENRLFRIQDLLTIQNIPPEKQGIFSVLGDYTAIVGDYVTLGLRTDENNRVVLRPFKYKPPITTSGPPVSFTTGTIEAAVFGIDQQRKQIYSGTA